MLLAAGWFHWVTRGSLGVGLKAFGSQAVDGLFAVSDETQEGAVVND